MDIEQIKERSIQRGLQGIIFDLMWDVKKTAEKITTAVGQVMTEEFLTIPKHVEKIRELLNDTEQIYDEIEKL